MTRVVIVGFALCVIVVVVIVVLWWSHDNLLTDHAERLERVEKALNLGGEPRVLVDPPDLPTEPMERIDLVGGARTSERPVPYKRQAKHWAPVTARGEVEG